MSASELLYADITEKIIGAAFAVHNSLGKGLTEKAYENALVVKLQQSALQVEQQKALPIFFENNQVGEQIVDLLVEDKIIIEIKAVEHLQKNHETQLLGYLKNTKFQVGLLVNFGTRVEFKRFVHSTQNKK